MKLPTLSNSAKWGIGAILVCLIVASAWLYRGSTSPVPLDLASFGREWQMASESRRQEMFAVVIGEPLKRHQFYNPTGTIFEGITLDEAEKISGGESTDTVVKGDGIVSPNGELMLYFDIGSIESDLMGFLIPGIAKRDSASFGFDAKTGVIVALRTEG